jgi:Cu/Zn superoxide dismutase
MGYSSPGCVGELVAEIEPYTGDEAKAGGPYTSEVTGMACVSQYGEGIIFTGSLKGLEDGVTGGFHIHSGTSCDDNASQGGHYYDATVTGCAVNPDPWKPEYGATYISTDQGEAAPVNINPGLKPGGVPTPPPITGGPFTVGPDPNLCGVAGRTVVIHREDGTRVGCGVLYPYP